MNSDPILCLIDTGAEVSTLPESLYQNHLLQLDLTPLDEEELEYHQYPKNLKVADGGIITSQAIRIPSFTLIPKKKDPVHLKQSLFFNLPGSDMPIIGMDLILKQELICIVLFLLKELYEESNNSAPLPIRFFMANVASVVEAEPPPLNFDNLIDKNFPLSSELKEILLEHTNMFKSKLDHKSLQSDEMSIKTIPNKILPKQSRRYISPENTKILDEYISELMELGFIEPCVDPPTICNSVIVTQGAKKRVCFDYTLLNQHTLPCYYPLPLIEELKSAVKDCLFFAKLDLTKGFHQLKLEKNSRPFTAFYGTQNRCYQYKVAPFGLSNTPSYFQSALTQILGETYFKDCLLYVDDILIFAKTAEDFILSCKKVLKKLHDGNVTLSPLKCFFGSKEVEFLGFLMDGYKFKLKPDRFAEIQDFSIPTNTKALRGFLGCCSAFRDYLVDYPEYEKVFSKLAAPNVKSKSKIIFTKEQIDSFDKMKKYIMTASYLYLPSFNQKYFLFTDASDYGYGGLLAQKINDDTTAYLNIINYPGLKPVGIISKNFDQSSTNWSTYEKELYAIVASFIKYDKYIGSSQVEVVTDHKNLIYLAARPSPKVIRWLIFLSSFNIIWKWLPGKINFTADFLSRCNPPKEQKIIRLQNFFKKGRGTVAALAYSSNIDSPTPSSTLQHCQEILSQKIDVSKCIAIAHNDSVGHNGAKATAKILDEMNLKWSNRDLHIKTYIKLCPVCQLNKQYTPVKYAGKITSDYPYHTIAADVVEFTFQDEVHYIIVYVDSFSLFTHLHHTSKVDSKEIANSFLLHIYASHGLPQNFKTDNAKYFNNKFLEELSRALGYTHTFSIANHSPSNGQAEVRIKRVLELLRKFLTIYGHFDSKIHIPLIQRLLNFTFSPAIQEFPAKIIFGIRPYNHPHQFLTSSSFKLSNSVDMNEYIKHLCEGIDLLVYESFKIREKYFRKRLENYKNLKNKDSYCFNKGDLVILPRQIDHRPHSKLLTSHKGPFEVIECTPPIITLMNGLTARAFQCNVAECTPFFLDPKDIKKKYPHLASTFLAEDEYIVEKILLHYGSLSPPIQPNVEFFIKWSHYDSSENSWEPYSNLSHLTILRSYLAEPCPYTPQEYPDIPKPKCYKIPLKRARR